MVTSSYCFMLFMIRVYTKVYQIFWNKKKRLAVAKKSWKTSKSFGLARYRNVCAFVLILLTSQGPLQTLSRLCNILKASTGTLTGYISTLTASTSTLMAFTCALKDLTNILTSSKGTITASKSTLLASKSPLIAFKKCFWTIWAVKIYILKKSWQDLTTECL